MFRYIIRRFLFAIPILIISSILVFLVVRSTIDPVAGYAVNPRVSAKDLARLRVEFGLDKSLFSQYTTWLSKFVRGDWGISLLSQRPVFHDIQSALANTVLLGVVATVFSLIVGVGIGVYSALRQYSWFDSVSTGAAFLGLSIPNFWFALLLQLFFGLYLTKWLHLREPIFYTAGRNTPGTVGRYMRASMLEVMHSDYLRTARAKGLKERRVVVGHAMRNALIPLTTQVAIDVGAIAGGLIITEYIFAWPGMGRFFVDAMDRGDYLQVLPWVMVTVAFVIMFNLVADILYAVLDPRIRYA